MYTTSATDLIDLFGWSYQSTYRWFSRHPDGYPPHTNRDRGRYFRLEDVVGRLRDARKRGLYGEELEAVVKHDAKVRRTASHEDLYIGEDVERRADKVIAALTPNELDRLKACKKAFTSAAISAGSIGLTRLRHALILHPAILRYVLTKNNAELPVGDLGWFSFSKALCVVNVVPSNEMEAA